MFARSQKQFFYAAAQGIDDDKTYRRSAQNAEHACFGTLEHYERTGNLRFLHAGY